jgi:protein TonB
MEQKKSPQVDMEQRRTTGFLLGLVFVLAVFYVTLEWNSTIDETSIDPLDLDELVHESELVPMSNEETVAQLVEKQPIEKAEQLNIVDDEVELEQSNEELTGEDEGADDETLLKELDEEQDKPLEAMGVDPNNPLNFHFYDLYLRLFVKLFHCNKTLG